MVKCSEIRSAMDKNAIEMKNIELARDKDDTSVNSEGGKRENDDDFAVTDLLSFSWQIAKGMVR